MARPSNARPIPEVLIDNALAMTSPGRCVWVALSGGLDSSLLLSVAAPLARQRGVDLRAIHVNHDLQAAAGDFESHCRELCDSLAVSLVVAPVTVSPAGQGIEAAARDARYQAFSHHLSAGDRLWLAQHADDQAETLLLATLRGSGVRGLAGMPVVRQWRGIAVERPWLGLARSELAREAARRRLAWCEDPTNAEVRFDRNYLRHRVLAPLRQRWPGAAEALARSAGHLQEADELLGELAEIDLVEAGGNPGCLRLSTLRRLTSSRRRLLIRHALERLDLPTPPAKRLLELERQLTTAALDRQPSLHWAGGEARLWREHLYLQAPLPPIDPAWRMTWDGVSPLETPWGHYSWVLRPPKDFTTSPLRVGLRQGGERLCLAGRGTRDLKRLLQEAEIPPWQRDRLALVWCGDELVAVLGVASAQGWYQVPYDSARPALC
jgi:tRNA(Ile)-lysidine synthase